VAVPEDFSLLDATAQAQLVREGLCTPAELVEAALARIELHNGALNAVIHRRDDKARREVAGAAALGGPFAGVPFAVKDLLATTAGDPYHCGMRFLARRGWTAAHDSWLVSRLRAAGLVIVGRTNTPELAYSFFTEPEAYGPARNPWDVRLSTGGSSGGSAAAVAAGLVPAAHGNDMGGSIRVPAALCGLVGLKPTRGRTSLGPDLGDHWAGATHEGVLTRSVRDTAALLDCIRGSAPGDPSTAPPPRAPYTDQVRRDPGRLRIGWSVAVDAAGTGDVDVECVDAVRATTALLNHLGHTVDDAAPAALGEDIGPMLVVYPVAVARELQRWSSRVGEPITAGDVEARTWKAAQIGSMVSATDYVQALDGLQAWTRRVARWWTPRHHGGDGYDVLVTPTIPRARVPLGGSHRRGAEAEMGRFTLPWNLTGQPAISLPLAVTGDGLPVGVQLVAGFGREEVLLRLAAQLERERPWRHRRPPLGWLPADAAHASGPAKPLPQAW
jgi:amidase